MKKIVILVLVLVVAAVFWSKKSEKTQEKNLEVNSDTEETDSGDTKLDEHLCSMARNDNTRASWESYLKEFPNGKCAKEGQSVRNQFRKVGNLEWSDALKIYYYYPSIVEWLTAYNYCMNLEENGHSDWRLPNIDELRMLIQNHSGTVAGGKCRISEEHNKLDEKYNMDDCDGIEGNNFSKFGDTGEMLSSSKFVYKEDGYDYEQTAVWVVNFDDGGVETLSYSYYHGLNIEDRSVRCVRQDDHDACETAKKYNTPYYWVFYFDSFPDGECAAEAKTVWEKEDKKACEAAKKANTRAAWEKYLKKFPKGQCAEEGRSVRSKFKKIGGFEWSDISDKPISAEEVENNSYCHNLREGGYPDWRLPTIDELRVLVQNHPGTVVGGKCKEPIFFHDEDICKGMKGDNFSKLGDKEELWSSSEFYTDASPHPFCNSIDFSNGGFSGVDLWYYNVSRLYVRCVRQDDNDACEAARKEETDEAWEYYLAYFPQGKCAAEAKNKIKEIETKKVEPEITWSSRSPKAMSWKQANQYCENLKEGSSSDWRLPTISELRTLVMKCGSTETGGTCRVTDQCLSESQCKNKACRGCGSKIRHNKFGDRGLFWSSSISPDNKNAWYIDFTYGSVHDHSKSEKFVRCVR